MIKDYDKPIYVIKLLSKMKPLISTSTKEEIAPIDLSELTDMGFYYSFEDAEKTMNNNNLDISEYCFFKYGFILKHYPGVYNNCAYGGAHNNRWFYKWNDEKGGFYQEEEPDIFENYGF